MSHIIKDSHYKDRYYQASVSSWGEEDVQPEQKKLKELSKNPMAKEVMQQALTNFGKTAAGPQYAFLSFIAQEKELYSILGIERFEHLQYVDLSRNNLITIRPLSNLKYITYLNVSHNKITKLLDLKDTPFNLYDVDYSFNQIKVIPDLSKHRFLKKLNLRNNHIEQIKGVDKNANLNTLILQENRISTIENLDRMNLTELNLRGNQITELSGLDKLEKLRILNISCNQIKKLKGLIDLISIRELWLSNNLIRHIKELQFVENLQYLSVLDLCFNPVQNKRYYRFQVLYHLPGLRALDGVLTSPEEFVKSENLYGLDLEERRRIFKEILPDEEFIDRRIHIGELIEPETESDNDEEIKFQDKYDKEGTLIEQKSALNFKKSMTGSIRSLKSGNDDQQFRDTQNSHQSLMNETARKLKAMRTSSIDNGQQQPLFPQ